MLASLATDFYLFSFAGYVSFLRHINKSRNRDSKYNSISVFEKNDTVLQVFTSTEMPKNELYVYSNDTDQEPSYQK